MKKVSAILIGAGQRGVSAYSQYALNFPNEFEVVAVAEPRADRLADFAKTFNIPPQNCFSDWKELLKKPKMADCAMVCTQDREHFLPTVQALKQGYHVLCEKPMSPIKSEIIEMGAMAKKYGRILSICHVLRYSPFFTKVKEILDSGEIGELVSVQHIECVAYWHQAHSFVRGNWRNSKQTSPMILQKSCHDMDILLWLIGSKCKSISSFGSLKHFTAANAPDGAPEYCLDGCQHRETCPYYAPKIYIEDEGSHTSVIRSVVSLDTSRAGLLKALEKGEYGRCVYRCDNDVVDNQVVNMAFDNGVTVAFNMCAFTAGGGRQINFMGSRGQLTGFMEENKINVYDFKTGNVKELTIKTPAEGHSGSDSMLMKDFVELVRLDGQKASKTSCDVSVESHLMALAAEESRVSGKTINFDEFANN